MDGTQSGLSRRLSGGQEFVYPGHSGDAALRATTMVRESIFRLYLSMMDKMNVRLPKFGDATKALEEV